LEEKIKKLTKLILHSSDQQAAAEIGQPSQQPRSPSQPPQPENLSPPTPATVSYATILEEPNPLTPNMELKSPRFNQLKQAAAKRRHAQRTTSVVVSTAVELDDASAELKKQLQDKIIELEQSKKTIEVLKQEVTTKDERLALLGQTVDLLQANISTLKKNISEKDNQLTSTHDQLILLSKQLGSPVPKSDTNKVDIESISKLKQNLVEKDLEVEVLKADNKLLITELNEKKQHLEQFVSVAETLEKNYKTVEEENKILKSKLKMR